MSYKKIHKILTLLRLVMVAFLVLLVLRYGSEMDTLKIIYLACFAVAAVITSVLAYKYLRCPSCGVSLQWRFKPEQRCPSCKARLDGGKPDGGGEANG